MLFRSLSLARCYLLHKALTHGHGAEHVDPELLHPSCIITAAVVLIFSEPETGVVDEQVYRFLGEFSVNGKNLVVLGNVELVADDLFVLEFFDGGTLVQIADTGVHRPASVCVLARKFTAKTTTRTGNEYTGQS